MYTRRGEVYTSNLSHLNPQLMHFSLVTVERVASAEPCAELLELAAKYIREHKPDCVISLSFDTDPLQEGHGFGLTLVTGTLWGVP